MSRASSRTTWSPTRGRARHGELHLPTGCLLAALDPDEPATMITPMPKRGPDATAPRRHPRHRTGGRGLDFLMRRNGNPVAETNTNRVRWPDSPIWSVRQRALRRALHRGRCRHVRATSTTAARTRRVWRSSGRCDHTDEEDTNPALRSGGPGSTAPSPSSPAGPTTAGPTRSVTGTRWCRRSWFTIHFMALTFTTPRSPSSHPPAVRAAGVAAASTGLRAREIYQGYGWRQDGPIPTLPDSDLVSPRLRTAGAWPFRPGRPVPPRRERWDVKRHAGRVRAPGHGPGRAGEAFRPPPN